MNIRNILFVATCLALLAGCTSESSVSDKPLPIDEDKVTLDEVKKEVGEASDTVTTYTKQEAEDAAAKMEKDLAALNAKIDELTATTEQRTEEMSEAAKEEWNQAMSEMEEKRDQAAEELAEFKSASGEAFAEIEQGFQSTVDDLQQTYEDAAKKFNTEKPDGE